MHKLFVACRAIYIILCTIILSTPILANINFDSTGFLFKQGDSTNYLVNKQGFGRDPNELLPVTVYGMRSSLRSKQKLMQHIDWVQHDAGQVLQQIPGFSAIRKSGTYGLDPVFRGFKYDQLNMVANGSMTASAACPNRMDPPTSQMLLSQVEKIEVFKGPHSFRYGPSMGATLNFVHGLPKWSDSLVWEGRVNSMFETNGQVFRNEAQIKMRAKRWIIIGSGSYSKGQNYRAGNDSIIPAGFQRSSVGLQVAYQIAKNQFVSLAWNHNRAKRSDFPILNMDLLKDDTRLVELQYQILPIQVNWYKKFTAQVFHSYVDHAMGNDFRSNFPSVHALVLAETFTWGGRAEWTLPVTNGELMFGFDFKSEMAHGVRTRTMKMGPMSGRVFRDTLWQAGIQQRSGAFLEGNKRVGNYQLIYSARLDRVEAKAQQPTAKYLKAFGNNTRIDWNTSLSLGVNRKWNHAWQTAIWIGRGVRSASLVERFIQYLPVGKDPYEMVGNPNLLAEANHQLDIQITYQTKKTFLQFSPFVSIVQNFITSVIDPNLKPQFGAPGVRSFINISQAKLVGGEFLWNQQLHQQLKQELSITYTHGLRKNDFQPLPEIAPLDMRYKLDWQSLNEKFRAFAQLRYVAPQNRIAKDFGEIKTVDFTVMDIGASYQLKEKLKLNIAVNNIWDQKYREHLNRVIPSFTLWSPGRNCMIQMTYQW